MHVATILIVFLLFFGGVWGTMVLRLFLNKRFSRPEVEAVTEDPRLGELLDETRLLEARLERVEEELGFLRELRAPETPAQLQAGEDRET